MSLSPEEIEHVQQRITAVVAKSAASVIQKFDDDFIPLLKELADRASELETRLTKQGAVIADQQLRLNVLEGQRKAMDTVQTNLHERLVEVEETLRTNYDEDRNGD
jgi:hypothetical protein